MERYIALIALFTDNAAPHLRGGAPAEPRKSGGDCCAKD